MAIGPHPFGDGRRGIMVIDPRNLSRRIARMKQLGFTDVFLPRNVVDGDGVILYTTTKNDLQTVKDATLFPAMWFVPEKDQTAKAFTTTVLGTIDQLAPNGITTELNIEMADEKLSGFVTSTIGYIRAKRKGLRLRINIAPFKARFMPAIFFTTDPQLYLCEQAYFGNMEGLASVDDVRRDMVDSNIPVDKGSVCFAGACEYPESDFEGRLPAIPAMSIREIRRGTVFQDDLLAEVGVLPA